MLTDLLAVIIAVVVVLAIFMAVCSCGEKYFDRKEEKDKEITKNAREIFKRHIYYIREYIEKVVPGMEGGINSLNKAVLRWNCLQVILKKEKMEKINAQSLNDLPEYRKLLEMISIYISFLIDKSCGGIGSSSEQLNYTYGVFLRENDLNI